LFTIFFQHWSQECSPVIRIMLYSVQTVHNDGQGRILPKICHCQSRIIETRTVIMYPTFLYLFCIASSCDVPKRTSIWPVEILTEQISSSEVRSSVNRWHPGIRGRRDIDTWFTVATDKTQSLNFSQGIGKDYVLIHTVKLIHDIEVITKSSALWWSALFFTAELPRAETHHCAPSCRLGVDCTQRDSAHLNSAPTAAKVGWAHRVVAGV